MEEVGEIGSLVSPSYKKKHFYEKFYKKLYN